LLIAATATEIADFLDAPHDGISVLITGVGGPSTLFALQEALFTGRYDWVIQAGIAGSFSKPMNAAQPLLVENDCFADLGIFENQIFTPLQQTALANQDNVTSANGQLFNPYLAKLNIYWPRVNAISVNTVGEANTVHTQMANVFQPQIESMEGAALHYVCLKMGIPFVQLRTITNVVGERDKSQWQFTTAFQTLNQALIELLNQIKQLS
jgi:futalosine hydrolase